MQELFSNSYEYSRNPEWLKSLAKFSLEQAHQASTTEKFYKQQEELTQTKDNLKKVVLKYKQLLESGKGKVGKGGLPVFGSSESTKTEADKDVLEEFEALLHGKTGIEQIIEP